MRSTKEDVLKELEAYGDASTKERFLICGAKEPLFGVKLEDIKKIQQKIQKDHELSLSLFATGNSDAMYLAGLIADEERISKVQLGAWADKAYWHLLSEQSVAWLAAESRYGFELGKEWIDSNQERIASAGWACLSAFASINEDLDLNLATYSKLLERVAKTIHFSPNRVRFAMNGFVIGVACSMQALSPKAKMVAEKIKTIQIQIADFEPAVPIAIEQIQQAMDEGKIGLKQKKARP